MKTMKIAAVAMLVGVAWQPAPAHANAEQLVASICDYVAANDKNRLRSKLKDSGVRLRNLYDGVKCNGESLLRFAMTASADDVGEFMAKKIPGSTLAEPEADGQTVLAWAEANGFAGSATAAAIKDRIN
ncbi:DUF3718 domain-containing protein [Gallaecimonas sp. GXIMD4217]|uniref:DUF3718 domain-containing protein n=1 Tax=Gallaecimonas sp. GXIMD4217 TaxID=3131927 RepID=UPI00311AE958